MTLAACSAAPNAAACTVKRVAAMAARVADEAILIPAPSDLRPVQMQVDTGAMTTLVDADAAVRLGLPSDPHRRTIVRGIGGQELTQNARVQSLDVGGQEWQMISLSTGRRVLPEHPTQTVAEVLGAIASAFDVELDLPHNRLTLWQVSGYSADFVLNGPPYYIVPLSLRSPNRLVAHVALNDHPAEALVGWGAWASTITTATAPATGLTPEMLANDRTATSCGLDGNNTPIRLHRFDTLRLGGETFHGPMLSVGSLNLPDVDMLLGIDFAGRRHIWLSYVTQQIFVVPARYAVAGLPRC